MRKCVAIIGAGVAGLAAAQLLRQCGVGVTVFEKSRGVGGRMATRRVQNLQFDHGVQYFTAHGDGFQALVDQWRAAGRADAWFDGAFVGVPGMTAPARAMAEGLAIIHECQVAALRRSHDGWSVDTAEGPVGTPDNGYFSGVILAVPAPQAMPLAVSAGVSLPDLDRVRYAPCWAAMLAFARPSGLTADRIRPYDEMIDWIARNASKPGRADDETVVIHAGPAWSRRHLEWSAAAALADIVARFKAITGITADPYFAAAHRWRYALVEEAAGPAFLWDAGARLGACGDWCLGARVEAAFDSGRAMGQAVAQSLEAARVD